MKKYIFLLSGLVIIIGSFIAYSNYENKLVIVPARDAYLNSTIRIKRKVEQHLTQLILDAQKDGMCLIVTSGYRSAVQQEALYETGSSTGLVADPGSSQHQLGTAVDFGGCPMTNGVRDDSAQRLELKQPFANLPEYQWLVQNASNYGFVQTYTATDSAQTGFPAEAWHWNYVK